MTYIIYGAGGIGGTIGAALHLSGVPTALIARGVHCTATQRDGLTFVTPTQRHTLNIATVDDPHRLPIGSDDVVILAMKSQHTEDAVRTLRSAAGASEPVIVCAQNGVDNERMALRRFERVVAMEVTMPTTHLQPGRVDVHTENVFGLLDLGVYPHGRAAHGDRIAAALTSAGFASEPRADIMAWKYRKLLRNLGNAVQALVADAAQARDVHRLQRQEAEQVYVAAGITVVPDEVYRARAAQLNRSHANYGERQGSSTWQSLLRGAASVEMDYLNGEIVLLGRLHGVPTPVNALIQHLANAHAKSGAAPGSYPAQDLLERALNAGSA